MQQGNIESFLTISRRYLTREAAAERPVPLAILSPGSPEGPE